MKTSRRRFLAAAGSALDFSGPDKLLFSSDHPWVQPKEILDPLRSLNLPAATEAMILSGNAWQLFKL